MALSPGSRIGQYEIRARLGAGGMGEVYRAHDGRLGRDVALKVLHAEVARDAVRLERFTREARAVAALNHPHIVTIYSTEEADGIRFMTMELIEGRPLDELVPREGLPVPRFLELALPLADALTAAHQKQITHRDLKPGNVMVASDGRVKVLDFGLARVAPAAPEHTIDATRAVLTGEGTIVGTMPYMSPEQVEGRSLDARSDLFSLGVMFYEMLTGARPFAGPSSPALMSAILRDVPPLVTERRADVPDALARLVARCLEKDPEARVQTARDVHNELRHAQKQIESGAGRRSGSGAVPTGSEAALGIAVLPFGARSADADTEALAAGLTEDVTSGLSRFPALSVLAPQSTRPFKDSPLDVRQVAERLGARYVLGGTVRRSASAVRIAAHLVDARSGAYLWTETYDQPLAGTDLFSIQDDVTDRIVATIADRAGVLARSMVQSVRDLPLDQLSARELIFRCWRFQWGPTPAEHAVTRAALERHLERHPDNPHVCAELAGLYVGEHSLFFNALPDPLERAMRMARRAVELDPGNQEGWKMMALASFYRRDEALMREAGDRAVRLNPRNSNVLAWVGTTRTHAGDYDGGCTLTERAMALNPAHPGWYHFPPFGRSFARGEFEEALRTARRANMPEFVWMHFAVAAAAGQLGLAGEARAAADAMLQLAPALADEAGLREFVTRWYWPPDLIEGLLDGVARARGGVSSGAVASVRGPVVESAGRAPGRPLSDPGGWAISVDRFAASGGEDANALAAGLTEDIATGLSRFGNLTVLARNARYVLGGSVRQSGEALRVTARVIDTTTGASIWANTYDRATEGGVFALQDDVAGRIVSTVADPTGVLGSAMATAIGDKDYEILSVQELVIRFHVYTAQLRPAEHARLRDAFERALEREPGAAEGWACLSSLYAQEHALRLNPRPDSHERERRAAERAVELDPQSPWAWTTLARSHMFARDGTATRAAVDRALALNPLNADISAHCAIYLTSCGEHDRALSVVRRAMQLKPHHQGWFYFPIFNAHYVRGEDEAALEAAKKINMPAVPTASMSAAAAAGQLGRTTEARVSLDELRKHAPQLLDPAAARAEWGLWLWSEALLDRLVDGFQKALALAGDGAAARPLSSGAATRGGQPAPTSSELRIAVLPFTARGGDDATALAEGLTDDITTGLSRFAHLRVVPAGAAEALTLESAPRSGVRYLLEGRVQGRGDAVRVTMRLIDGTTGANLWADTFDRPLGSTVFEVQDDLGSYIVATIGDTSGVLARSMAASLLQRPVEELGVRELVLRFHAYVEHFQADEHARLRAGLERALGREPHVAEGWACLADLYEHEHSQRLNPLPDSLGRQRRAAERALEIDPHNQRGWTAMAAVHTFGRDRAALRVAVERAIALNPLDADTVGLCALFLSCAGDDDRAMELFARAVRLKPQHPGWYHFPPFTTHYKRREYTEALAEAKRINLPQLPTVHISAAAAAARVGSAPEAQAAVEALRRLDARFLEPEAAREAVALWIWDHEYVQDLIDGLAEAIALTSGQMDAAGGLGADPGMRIAVLPFTARGGDEAEALAEGITDEITTALARFPYLRVVSRAAVAALEGHAEDAHAASTRLGASFLLEGSVRKAGSAIRVSARLADVESGAHLWAETFDREIAAGVFAVQDDLAGCITSQVADPSGALVRTMASARREVPLEELTTAELTLQFFAHLERFDPAQHAALRDAFERALDREPNDATAWGCLSDLYMQEIAPGLNPRPDPLERQRAAAERAIAIDATCQYGWLGLAVHRFYTGDWVGSAQAGERAIALNPLNTHVIGLLGNGRALAGDWDHGLALVRRALDLNPHIAGHVHLAPFLDSYRRGDDEAALASAKRFNIPTLSVGHLNQAAAAGQLGRAGDARAALEALRRVDPALCEPAGAREAFGRILRDAALVQRLAEGFEKALALVAAPDAADSDAVRVRPSSDASGTGLGRGAALSVAVQPFTGRSDDADAAELARGLTDDVTTGLARFRYVRVRSVTAAGGGQEPRSAAAAAGAAYVLDGAIRRSGVAFRVSARLTDVATGEHLWAEQYDREVSSSLFVLQDDLASRIVATLADGGGVLGRLLTDALRDADPRSANGLYAGWSGYVEHFTPDRHAALRDGLEALVAQQPDSATAWAYLSILYGHEMLFDFNPRPDPVSRVRHAAERAVTLDPDNQSAWYALAEAEFFERHLVAFRSAAERAIQLNPLQSRTVGGVGLFYYYAGDTDRGAALVARAMSLNPRVPGWFHIVPFLDAYRRGDADAAFTHAARINMPHLPVGGRLFAIAAAGRFGREREARDGIRLVGESRPDLLGADAARREWSRWMWEGELLDALVEGYAAALSFAPDLAPHTPAGSAVPRPASADSMRTVEPPTARPGVDPAMRVAVLPFNGRGGDDASALAEGLTDDITTALARFPYLQVVSRAAVQGLRIGADDARAASAALGARFLLEGNVRQAAGAVRVGVRLSDVETGAHLWAETFDRDVTAGVFAVQDDVVSRVAATVGDSGGVLVRTIASGVRGRPIESLDTGELVLRYHGDFAEHFSAADHAALRDAFEAAVVREPAAAMAWACLAMLYALEVFFGLNPKPNPQARLREAAERANTLDPTIQHGWVAMATAALFDHDRAALQAATDRALALNPLHTRSLATLGLFTVFSGDASRGMQLMDRSIVLNPRHPGWYLLAPFLYEYERGDFLAALGFAKRIGMPKFVAGHLAAAAAAGQVGTREDAKPALEALERFDPRLIQPEGAHDVWACWIWDEGTIDRLVGGLEKAQSIAAVTPPPSSAAERARPGSSPVIPGTPRSATGLSVAVLPLKARSNDDESIAIADGLTDLITTGLSRFGYLQVLSRSIADGLSSTHESHPHARYALEGSVRRDGAKVRIAVTLVDTDAGSNLWTSTYDRDIGDGTFPIQDDVSSAVVATIGDQTGVLMRAMAAATVDRPLDQLTIAELVIRYHVYADNFDPAEHERLRMAFEHALEREPRAAEGWACLSLLYEHEHGFGFNPLPDSRGRERRAAERAHELDPNSQQVWIAMAGAHCFARDREGLKHAAERAAAINPLNADLLALGAIFLSVAGEDDRATALVQQAMRLKPHHAGWYYYPLFNAAYSSGDYEEAWRTVRKINMPRMPLQHANAAAVAGLLGLEAEARAALRALRDMDPRLAEVEGARALWSRWAWSESLIESRVDGFTKARRLEERSRLHADGRSDVRASADGEQSIAVLPFTDLSERRDQEWFCDGIAEEILNALTALPGLRVAARTSAFTFRGRGADLRAVADALGVATVLQGSVRRAGDRVRITVQLVDAQNGFQLWSDRYERQLADIFDVQDEIARGVADRLRVTLSPSRARVVERRTGNIAAYEEYLRGRALLYQRGASIVPALEQFRKAVEIDPGFALAWAGIADAYVVSTYFGLASGAEARRHGLAAAHRALAITPDSAEAHTALAGLQLLCLNDRVGAGRSFERALELNPFYIQARCWYALFYLQWTYGRFEEGVAEAERALALDPLSAYVAVIVAVARETAGRPADAISVARRAAELDPRSFLAHWILARVLAAEGDLDAALASMEHAAAISARHPFALAGLAALHMRHRRADLAVACYDELLGRAGAPPVTSTHLALAADAVGRRDEALIHARQALDDREPPFILLARHFPDFESLRGDPRFASLLGELDALPPLDEEG